MASGYINNWIKEIDDKILYWHNNFLTSPHLFYITPRPSSPVIFPNILNHNLTSCYVSTTSPIDFSYFPEPYYGNPDDDTLKLTVVLFYNPGPAISLQNISTYVTGSFNDKYLNNCKSYYSLSTHLDFCDNTINGFWKPKKAQLKNLFQCLNLPSEEFDPLFMDIIPWHSSNFNGISLIRLKLQDTKKEFISKVIIPAVLNAKNSLITKYVKETHTRTNKIILFAIGAKYKKYLPTIGFKDFTSIISTRTGIPIDINSNLSLINSKLKIWKIAFNDLISDIEADIKEFDSFDKTDIYIINLWTPNIGMNISTNICCEIKKILDNLYF